MADGAPRTIAHRGFAGAAPENTVGAVRFAADRGADLVEVDVMPSADGAVVVFHDDRLDDRGDSRGITDGTGAVTGTAAGEVTAATVLDSGETVPTLEAVRQAVPEGVGLNVELKRPGATDPMTGGPLPPATREERAGLWAPFVRDVLDALEGFDDEVLFSSFAEGALAALRRAAPAVALAPIVVGEADAALALAARYDAAAIHPSTGAFDLSSGAGTFLDRAHEAGFAVNVWTVRTWHEAHRLSNLGVDGLIVDYPDLGKWDHRA